MSDYFRMIKDGNKLQKVTADDIDWNYFNKIKADYEKKRDTKDTRD